MSITASQVIEDVKSLSAKERAFLARCLISSLDTTQEESVDDEWARIGTKKI